LGLLEPARRVGRAAADQGCAGHRADPETDTVPARRRGLLEPARHCSNQRCAGHRADAETVPARGGGWRCFNAAPAIKPKPSYST
jgi:hypothetical protein